MFKINKLEQEVNQLRSEIVVVREQLAGLSTLKDQLETLVERVAILPRPNRDSWQRTAGPAFPFDIEGMDTQIIPIAQLVERRNSKKLAQLPPPPENKVARMYFCEHGPAQFVYAYDRNGEKLGQYTGWVRKIGVSKLLAVSAGVVWEEKKPGTPEWDAVFSTASA